MKHNLNKYAIFKILPDDISLFIENQQSIEITMISYYKRNK